MIWWKPTADSKSCKLRTIVKSLVSSNEAKTSGEGLYQDFTYYANNTNRKASGESKIKCNNRIKDQKRVIELLINENAKSKAITELNLLKAKLESLT